MHSVNLDLLRASSRHHADGRPKDPHAHHQAGHLARRRAARHITWAARLARLALALGRYRKSPGPPTCPTAPSKA